MITATTTLESNYAIGLVIVALGDRDSCFGATFDKGYTL
jgi:hypothetical protein